MNEEQRAELKKAANQMPTEAVRTMEQVLKSFFNQDNIPYNADTLKAAQQMCMLIHPNIPPIHAQFVASATLLLMRLIDEEEHGLITGV